jgi:hypothetical protein
MMGRRLSRGVPLLLSAAVVLAGFLAPTTLSADTQPLVLGWFSSNAGEHNFGAYEASGANIVENAVWPPDWRDMDNYLAQASAHNLQVLVGIPNRFVRRLDLISKVVRRYRNDPNVWGWYLYDEPDYAHLAPATLGRAYQTIKNLDDRPVVVTFMSGHCHFSQKPGALDPAYLQTFDVLSIDHFVLFQGMPEFEDLAPERSYYDQCVQSARQYHKLGTIIIVQAFGHLATDHGVWRDPTINEEKLMTSMAAQSGALGIMYWSDFRADSSVFNNVNQVIKSYNPPAVSTGG